MFNEERFHDGQGGIFKEFRRGDGPINSYRRRSPGDFDVLICKASRLRRKRNECPSVYRLSSFVDSERTRAAAPMYGEGIAGLRTSSFEAHVDSNMDNS